ncbi:Fructose-bisphosphate aldolase class-I, putative [Leishmania guyanensis]
MRFLSGGLGEPQSLEYLNTIRNAPVPRAWGLTFTFWRARKAWKGKGDLILKACKALLNRAKMNACCARQVRCGAGSVGVSAART